tara:strand:- start:124523 stop:124720 length:198 start_codon:yes stop_codon:yes gene_type:complete
MPSVIRASFLVIVGGTIPQGDEITIVILLSRGNFLVDIALPIWQCIGGDIYLSHCGFNDIAAIGE